MRAYFKLATLAYCFLFPPLLHGATSLHQALVATYQTNPTLAAKRDEKSAVDALHIRTFAEFLPSVSLQAGKRFHSLTDKRPSSRFEDQGQSQETLTKSLNLSWDVFEGGGSLAQAKSYQAKMAAKDADLKATEQTLLLKCIKSYLDVWTKEASLKVNEKAERNYSETLALTQKKLKAGIASQSDVERARSEYQRIKSRLLSTQSDLKAAIAIYENITGILYEGVKDPVILIALPQTQEEAHLQATTRHPALLFANCEVEDAEAQDTFAKTRFSPRVRLEGALTHHHVNQKDDTQPRGHRSASRLFDRGVSVTLTVPLLQKGFEYAQLKEASNILAQKKNLRRQMQQDILQSIQIYWSAWVSAVDQTESYARWVKSAAFLKSSIHQEHHFGLKTLFDVYQAEKELLDAEYALIESRRSEVVYAYELLALMGQLTAKTLKLQEPEATHSFSNSFSGQLSQDNPD